MGFKREAAFLYAEGSKKRKVRNREERGRVIFI